MRTYSGMREFTNERDVFLEDFGEKHKAIVPARNNAQEITRSMKLIEERDCSGVSRKDD